MFAMTAVEILTIVSICVGLTVIGGDHSGALADHDRRLRKLEEGGG